MHDRASCQACSSSDSAVTAASGGRPAAYRSSSVSALAVIALVSAPSDPATCGVITTLGSSYSTDERGSGSGSVTSSTACSPARHACSSAAWSTSPPLAVLISVAPGGSAASSAPPIMCLVAGSSGACRLSTSARGSASAMVTSSAPAVATAAGSANGSTT